MLPDHFLNYFCNTNNNTSTLLVILPRIRFITFDFLLLGQKNQLNILEQKYGTTYQCWVNAIFQESPSPSLSTMVASSSLLPNLTQVQVQLSSEKSKSGSMYNSSCLDMSPSPSPLRRTSTQQLTTFLPVRVQV